MKCRRRMGAVHRYDVHMGEHLIEAFPIGRPQLFLHGGRNAAAVVIIDGKAERFRAPRHGPPDAAHADNAELFTPNSVAEHPGWRPSSPLAALLQIIRALDQPARHGKDERHRHISRILGENTGRVRYDDAAITRGFKIDIIDTRAIISDELQLWPGKRKKRLVNPVGYGRNEHGSGSHRSRQLVARHGGVRSIQGDVEQLPHASLDEFGEFAGNDDFNILWGHRVLGWPVRLFNICNATLLYLSTRYGSR